MKILRLLLIVSAIFIVSGCLSQDAKILQSSNQVQLRSIQTRAFDSTDKVNIVRNVISTLQDLDFVIDKADAELGTVSGTKLSKGSAIKMSVTVRPRNKSQMLVRANARYNVTPITNPAIYQDFFTSLQKSLFLTAQAVE